MNGRRPGFRLHGLGAAALVALLSVFSVRSAVAQVGLFVEHDAVHCLVRKIDGTTLMFEHDGQWLRAGRRDRISLRPLNEFLPYVVTLRDVKAVSEVTDVRYNDGSFGRLGTEVSISTEIESAYLLENVFLVVEIETADGPRTVHRGIGRLQPGQKVACLVRTPTIRMLGGHRYVLHLFSDGMELLHTEQPVAFREAQLDRIVARRIARASDSEIQPLVGPEPVYPASLKTRRTEGEAVVRLKVTPRGAVREAELVSATMPEFGPPALAAAKEWRFLPSVRDGVPLAGLVEMPFKFTPPVDAK